MIEYLAVLRKNGLIEYSPSSATYRTTEGIATATGDKRNQSTCNQQEISSWNAFPHVHEQSLN